MIIVDTGFIVAAATETDSHHIACTRALAELRKNKEIPLLPATVSAETGYMLCHEGGPRAEIEFLDAVACKEFQPVELGTTDASIVAIAERLGIVTIATVDRRHFTAVRPRHVNAFSLLPAVL